MKWTTKIVLIAGSVFILWNIAWFFVINASYQKYTEPVPKLHGVNIKEDDGYVYLVKKPEYLRLTGNLGISKKDSLDGLIIWPLLDGGYEYGIRLQKGNGEIYEILIDKSLNPINKADAVAMKVLEENKKQVHELASRANEMWNIEFDIDNLQF